MDIVVAQEVGASLYGCVVIGGLFLGFRLGEIEKYDIQVFVLAYQAQAVLVGSLQEVVVTIDELYVLTFCHAEGGVASDADTLVPLSYIDDVVAILHQAIHGTHL